ncbi:MAG: IclR family transcriptional regulator [Phycisphaeraceae bacterium]|nr:IclR family transcriptional regulator [Phycisphaeraceae bacterium]
MASISKQMDRLTIRRNQRRFSGIDKMPKKNQTTKQAGKKTTASNQKASKSAMQLIYDDDDISERLGKDRNFNWSLARGLEILRSFSVRSSPLGNGELAEITKLPKATVSRLTHTLTELGYLSLNQQIGKYEPTPAILALGYPVIASMKIRALARDHLQQLANDVNLTVAIGSRDRSSMIYVDASHPSTMMTLRLDLGSRVDMAKTSLGRAFLWGISELERDIIFAHFERRYGEEWPAPKNAIMASFEQIDQRGFCIVDGEWQPDIRGVGVPLVSSGGGTVLALNAAGPRFAADMDTLENVVGPRLVHLCRSLSPMLS